MSSRTLKRPRVKRVIRAIIVGYCPKGELEFLLFQRSKTAIRLPNHWECIGGSLDPSADKKAIHALLRECSEEAGITVSRIIQEVDNEHRPWVPASSHDEQFESYHATHFLVETPTIKEVRIGLEHRGYGWFSRPHIGIMQRLVRKSSYTAIRKLPGEIESLIRVNPRHR